MRTWDPGAPVGAPRLRRRRGPLVIGLSLTLLAGGLTFIATGGTAGAAPAPGTFEIVAGVDGSSGFPTGAPGPGTSLDLHEPLSVAVDAQGDTYIADFQNSVVEKLTPQGELSIFAGHVQSSCPSHVTPGPATQTGLCEPDALAVDGHGDVFIADADYEQVFKVTPAGTLSVAVASGIGDPGGLAVDGSGTLYVSDRSDSTIRKVTPSGVTTVFAGGGSSGVQPGPATGSQLDDPANLAVDGHDNLYIADSGNNVVEKVTPAGVLSVVAGTGSATVPATSLSSPSGVAVDSVGNVYIANSDALQVDEVTPSGAISRVAGNGECGHPPVNGRPATETWLFGPSDVAVDPSGDLVIADTRAFDDGDNSSLIEKVIGLSPPTPTPTPTPPTPTTTVPSISGYWSVAGDGGVFSFGSPFFGSAGGLTLNQPVVGIASTADGKGYWTVARDGGVFAYGDATFHGSLPTQGGHVGDIVGMAADAATGGYWLVGSDGSVYAFDAPSDGSLPGLGQHVSDIVGMAAGFHGGYDLVSSAGAVDAFGGAAYHGGANTLSHRNAPIVGIAVDPATGGYWLAGADGGVYAFDAPFEGSAGGIRLNGRVVGIAATASGSGYQLVASDGGVFSYGDAHFFGSMGGKQLNAPVVGLAERLAAQTGQAVHTAQTAQTGQTAQTAQTGRAVAPVTPHC